MTIFEVVTVFAMLGGPICAVLIQRQAESRKEKNERQLAVFRTLMSTRTSKVSIEHVQALNLIDVEFGRDSKATEILHKWKEYHAHLGDEVAMQANETIWGKRGEQIFAELLTLMANHLNYKFDKTHLQQTAYIPKAHSEIESEQTFLRRGFNALLLGRISLPIQIVDKHILIESEEALEQEKEEIKIKTA